MNHQTLAQMGGHDEFITRIIAGIAVFFGIFLINLYIFRAVFNIPSFLRYQRAQIRLLEEMAKTQGVDNTKVQSIISESMGWEPAPPQSPQASSTPQ